MSSRCFLYGDFEITVVGNEYFIVNERLGTKELIYFHDDIECIRYLRETYNVR